METSNIFAIRKPKALTCETSIREKGMRDDEPECLTYHGLNGRGWWGKVVESILRVTRTIRLWLPPSIRQRSGVFKVSAAFKFCDMTLHKIKLQVVLSRVRSCFKCRVLNHCSQVMYCIMAKLYLL
jgi:hypothetical protein